MRPYLLPASWMYGGVVALRNMAFDRGILRSGHAGVPVVSVGNISVGGTGKTPLTGEVARVLHTQGHRIGILSRGYRRRSTGFRWVQRGEHRDTDAVLCGDEPVLLAEDLPWASVAVCEDRVEGARRMVAEAGVEAVVLDDGFQHRRIHRDLDIVAVTAAELKDPDALLPAGRGREPGTALRRAGFVVVTGCRDADVCRMSSDVVGGLSAAPVACARLVIAGFRDAISGREAGEDTLQDGPVAAVSALGNPRSFEDSLADAGIGLAFHMAFPDHHAFTAGDVAALRKRCEAAQVRTIIMTQKDAVKFRSPNTIADLGGIRAMYAVARVGWVAGGEEFQAAVIGAMTRPGSGV